MIKQVSPRRSEAARLNGAKSRGPKSDAGKAKSRFNALTHGLTAQTLVLPGENQDRFQTLLDGLLEDHAPQSTTAALLVEQMATSAWRLRRTIGFEKSLIQSEIRKSGEKDPETRAAQAWAGSGKAHLLARYEATHQRVFRQSLRDLLNIAPAEEDNDEMAGIQNEPKPEEDRAA